MTPAILQMLQGASAQSGSLAQIKQIVTGLRNLRDPQALMQQMMQQSNPQLAQAIRYVREHGGDPKAAFEALAAERGIDPGEVEALMK